MGVFLFCIKRGEGMPEGGTSSMFDTVKDHEERISNLEEADRKHEERLKVVESNYTKLENTILKSSQSQQDFFRDTMSKQWELIKARDETKETELQRAHEINLTTQALKKTNSEKAWEFGGKLIMGGGILYLLIEKIISSIGGN